MALYSWHDGLMCKVFPSSLGPTTMRWFNHSFSELVQAFDACFITCNRALQPIDALLSMKMRSEETLRSYSDWYKELYNEIGGGNKQVAANTFKLGLPKESKLRGSLTMRPPENMHQLMRRIKEHKRLEDDKLQSKRKAPTTLQYPKDPRHEGF